jgi:hypothetical protein
VPMDNGNFQVEWHFGGWDVEIEVHGDTAEVLGALIAKRTGGTSHVLSQKAGRG